MEITIDEVLKVIKALKRHKILIQLDNCEPCEIYDFPLCDIEFLIKDLNEAIDA